MAEPTTMLYQCPGPHQIHGGWFDYVIVPDDEVSDALAHGWFLTTPEAKAAHDAAKAETSDDAAPTRAELEQKATELGIAFDGRTGDKTLVAKIAQALKA